MLTFSMLWADDHTIGRVESSAGESILVVEDDPALRRSLAAALEQDGFQVTTAGDGATAVDLCRTDEPDLVLLDYELPNLSGRQACRQIREFSSVYIVMLTGRSSEIDKVASLSQGADDYVTKPFSFPELLARVHTILRRPRSRTVDLSQRRDFGPLSLDPASRVVRVHGKEVSLTEIEYGLLDELTKAPDTAVTREHLLRSIWKTEWSEQDHVVDVHVHNLRKKLTKAGLTNAGIRTIRGVGLRLETAELREQISSNER
jgi:DNA-binding response OmpR family regulator